MTSYAWDVQTAVYAVIVAASIPGIAKIVDAPITKPEVSDYPFIEIGAAQSIQDDADCFNGSEEYIDVHVWSRYRGQKEVKKIMGEVHKALHNTSLVVPALASAFAFVEGSRVFSDPDGLTRHGVLNIRVYCREV
jgi:hypothetical protein